MARPDQTSPMTDATGPADAPVAVMLGLRDGGIVNDLARIAKRHGIAAPTDGLQIDFTETIRWLVHQDDMAQLVGEQDSQA